MLTKSTNKIYVNDYFMSVSKRNETYSTTLREAKKSSKQSLFAVLSNYWNKYFSIHLRESVIFLTIHFRIKNTEFRKYALKDKTKIMAMEYKNFF